MQRLNLLAYRLQIEIDPLRLGKLDQLRPIRLSSTGMTQQHQDPLLGLDKLRMAQLALALETVEALAQRVISTESGSASTGQPPISTRSLDWRRRKPTRVQLPFLSNLMASRQTRR